MAPMMKRTDKHFRFLVRLISPNIRLFTEMVPAQAILYGNKTRHLGFSIEEKPLALQIGTGDPLEITKITKIPQVSKFDEINLNCGCPSPTVQNGDFGVKLMLNPKITRECISTLRHHIPDDTPISIKIRLGVDNVYSYDYLHRFVDMAIEAGVSVVFIHARKALLKINPKKNREVPPLNYDWVYRLKEDFPKTKIVLNGGIRIPREGESHLRKVDGIMLGRIAYENPMLLADFESLILNKQKEPKLRIKVIEKYIGYIENQFKFTMSKHRLTHGLLNIFHGEPKAKEWRLFLAEQTRDKKLNLEKIYAKAVEIHMINNV